MAPSIHPPAVDTPVGKLRLLTGDSVLRKDPKDRAAEASYYYEDDALAAFLDMEDGYLKLAAANVLLSFASNEALVSKKIRTETLQTDGPAVAAELRLQAQAFRTEGKLEREEVDAAAGNEIAIVDFDDPISPFDYFQYINASGTAGGVPWH